MQPESLRYERAEELTDDHIADRELAAEQADVAATSYQQFNGVTDAPEEEPTDV